MPAGYNLPSPEYYEENDILKQYQSMLAQVFSDLLPTAASRKSATKLAESVVELEKKIAALTPPPEDRQDVTVSDICKEERYICREDTNDDRNTTISSKLTR